MRMLATIQTSLLAAALVGCVGPTFPSASQGGWPQIYGVGCPFAPGVTLDGGGGTHPPTPLAAGETRLVGASIDNAPGGCAAGQGPFQRMQWFDLENFPQARIQIRLESCEACTVLQEHAGHGVEQTRGVALMNGAQRVILRVTGLSPGRATLYLQACADEHCVVAAGDSRPFHVD